MRPTGQTMHILRVFHLATQEETLSGLTWYRDSGDLALRRMRAVNRKYKCGYSITRSVACGVIAAMSPRKNWGLTLDAADIMVRTGDAPTYKTQVAKATCILGGHSPEDVLVGPKERAFYYNLANPDTSMCVTVDGHALNIWLNELKDISKVKVGSRLYRLASQDYTSAAALMGIRPHQMQAITWLAWRRIHNSKGYIIDQRKGL